MTERTDIPLLESVLREEKTHRLGLSSAESGRVITLETVVGDVDEPFPSETTADIEWFPKRWGGRILDGVVLFGMQSVEGEPLAVLFKRTQATALQRRAWLLQVVRTMAQVHASGAAYGLCHPHFLLAGSGGRILFPEPLTAWSLLHAGVSASGGGRLGAFQGLVEPWYVAPEWVRSGTRPTLASDVFQLCAMLAHDTLGESPYGKGLTLEVANRVISGNPAALLKAKGSFSSYWSEVLLRGLRPDPSARFANAGALLEALLATPEADSAGGGPFEDAESKPYWHWFQAVPAAKSTFCAPAQQSQQVAEGRLLIEQLQRLKVERVRSGTLWSENKWGRWVLGGVLAIAAAVGLWVAPELAHSTKPYEGTVTEGDVTITHRSATQRDSDGSKPGLSEATLVNSLPGRVSKQLVLLGVPLDGELAFEPPVLPPYRVRVRSASGQESLLEFASRDRLSRVILVGAKTPQAPAWYTVLYDASGEPKALMPFDPLGYSLPLLALPEAAMAPPATPNTPAP